MIAVEPDARLADHLTAALTGGFPQLEIVRETFEDVSLPAGGAEVRGRVERRFMTSLYVGRKP